MQHIVTIATIAMNELAVRGGVRRALPMLLKAAWNALSPAALPAPDFACCAESHGSALTQVSRWDG